MRSETRINNQSDTVMLEYYKTVLGKVSFDPTLFRKELRKAFRTLVEDEKLALRDWLKESTHM